MKEIEFCPHCKGKAHLDFSHEGNKPYIATDGTMIHTAFTYIVFCEDCGARTNCFEDPEMAINAWNRRVK